MLFKTLTFDSMSQNKTHENTKKPGLIPSSSSSFFRNKNTTKNHKPRRHYYMLRILSLSLPTKAAKWPKPMSTMTCQPWDVWIDRYFQHSNSPKKPSQSMQCRIASTAKQSSTKITLLTSHTDIEDIEKVICWWLNQERPLYRTRSNRVSVRCSHFELPGHSGCYIHHQTIQELSLVDRSSGKMHEAPLASNNALTLLGMLVPVSVVNGSWANRNWESC